MHVTRYTLKKRLYEAFACLVCQEEAIDGLIDAVLRMPLADAMIRTPKNYLRVMKVFTDAEAPYDDITFGRALAIMATGQYPNGPVDLEGRMTVQYALTRPFEDELTYRDPSSTLIDMRGDMITEQEIRESPAMNYLKPPARRRAGIPLAERLASAGSQGETYVKRLAAKNNPYRGIMIPTEEGVALRRLIRNVSFDDYYARLKHLHPDLPLGTVETYEEIHMRPYAYIYGDERPPKNNACWRRSPKPLFEYQDEYEPNADRDEFQAYMINALPLGLIAADRLGMSQNAA